jgi:hypothetical protein
VQLIEYEVPSERDRIVLGPPLQPDRKSRPVRRHWPHSDRASFGRSNPLR